MPFDRRDFSVSCRVRRFLQILALIAVATAMGPLLPAATAAPATSSYCFDRELDDGRPRVACIGLGNYTTDICGVLERYAVAWNLPPAYFGRLIWQESHFNANAVSSAGAEGIAQFMPETGRLQGLANPYNPAEELWRSAGYLDFLQRKFGNLGLAAAAYNGGENRLSRFIAGTGYLADETLNYVQAITGVSVTDWLAGDVATDYALEDGKPFQEGCIELARNNRVKNFTPPTAIIRPWGVQLAEFFSSANARRAFARIQQQHASVLGREGLMLVARRNPNFGRALRYIAQIGRDSRKEAQALCDALHRAGGACLVVRN